MITNRKAAILSAAVTGLLSAAGCAKQSQPAEQPGAQAPATQSSEVGGGVEKHACKGQNSCKGQGGCKTDKNACKGMNSCKGQGGCKTT